MSRTKTFFFIAIISLVMVGCKVTPPVKIEGLEVNKPYLIDSSKELDYPGFMAGAGNIYSCRYGIYYKRSDEFTPTKDIVFSGLLSKNLPNIETHKVELFRFDVFYNKRLKQLQAASYMGGIVGMMAADAAKRGTMVTSGDRSAKIRTYNYAQGRVTDHRIGLTLYSLDNIIAGDIDEIVEGLKIAENSERSTYFRGLFHELLNQY